MIANVRATLDKSTRLNPLAKSEALQSKAWRNFVAVLANEKLANLQNSVPIQMMAATQTVPSLKPRSVERALNELYVSMGVNAYKLALAKYLSTLQSEDNSTVLSKLPEMTFYISKQGSDVGRLFWSVAQSQVELSNWRENVSARQQKVNKGRKKKSTNLAQTLSNAIKLELWHVAKDYYAKSVLKNRKHVICLDTLLANLKLDVAKLTLTAEQSAIDAFLFTETERLTTSIKQAMKDYLLQIQVNTGLERSIQQLRQVDKQMTKLIKLYLFVLKFGAKD